MKPICTALLLLICMPSMAATISYDYLDLSYITINTDETDSAGKKIKADGFGLGISASIAPAVFVIANVGSAETNKLEVDLDFDDDGFVDCTEPKATLESINFSLGFGIRHNINNQVHIFGAGAIQKADIEGEAPTCGATLEDDDTGFGLTTGLRTLIADQVELDATLAYVSIFDETDTAVGLQLVYHVDPRFSLVAGYTSASDADTINIGGRINFGVTKQSRLTVTAPNKPEIASSPPSNSEPSGVNHSEQSDTQNVSPVSEPVPSEPSKQPDALSP